MGSGIDVGQKLVEHRGINAISFTGSVPVGRGIAQAAVGNFTKLQMEMGSKNALAVMMAISIWRLQSLLAELLAAQDRSAPPLHALLCTKLCMTRLWKSSLPGPRP